MESKAKLFGHPIHQMLIVFPLGLLGMATLFDIIYLLSGQTQWVYSSYWMILAGLVSGVIAAFFGWIDWKSIPTKTRAKRIGIFHALGNGLVLLLFLVSWWIRRENMIHPPAFAFVASLLGMALSLVTGWLGGELVDRLGVGVHPNAHLNAESSLRKKAS